MRWYFGFFFVSGFCSILYELVWLRLAMAEFAVTAAFVSIVLATFMAGLGLGSWGAGYYVTRRRDRLGFPALRLYALTELLIGISAILVPLELAWGKALLERFGSGFSSSVGLYYLVSGIWIALILAPWCACMGATFPLAMSAIRQRFPSESPRSFSYLYLANISGAVAGTVVPLFLIEELGFKGTLRVGAGLNVCLAACAMMLALGGLQKSRPTVTPENSPDRRLPQPTQKLVYLLFATGLTSMGVEVVWVRLFTPFLGTVVYAFASILGLYLIGTYWGSKAYRRDKSEGDLLNGHVLVLLGGAVLLPLVVCDPRLPIPAPAVVVFGVVPFSLVAGFLTPMMLDRVSRGDPNRAGAGYAINIAGCTLGPLLSGFLLLPVLGERGTLYVFALPWLAIGLILESRPSIVNGSTPRLRISWKSSATALIPLTLVLFTKSFEEKFYPRRVLRDHTATVIATGFDRVSKKLLVNGIGMTTLTTITKMMAHLPLAFLQRPPKNALVICFGMGTTHRTILSWGIHSTAVELVPSVPSLFSYFHADGARLLQLPLSRIVIDDGRSYLDRSSEQFDVIVVDPPPPVPAAASSLLYSKEFYAVLKRHLPPDGIVQQWLPNGDSAVRASVAKALAESFPHVRAFQSIEGPGLHFLASSSPVPSTPASVLASRLPPLAASDLVEWEPAPDAEKQFARVVRQEILLDDLVREDPAIPALQDDRPVNEYFILRILLSVFWTTGPNVTAN